MHPTADISANIIIGLSFIDESELNINWLDMLPIDPKTELIPNPIPLRGKGNSSVM